VPSPTALSPNVPSPKAPLPNQPKTQKYRSFSLLDTQKRGFGAGFQSFAQTTFKSKKTDLLVVKNETKPSFALLHVPG
jgi:hypothetical protein